MIELPPLTSDRPARVLIVDDERPNRQLLEVMLSPAGYQIQLAAGGREALSLIDAEPPDLILLDVMMPDMDGYEVAAAVKSGPTTRNIPIILVTAIDDRAERIRGLSAGAEDFLTKPVDRAELSVRVRNLLRLKAYGDYHDRYGQILEGEVALRTADLRHQRDRAQQYLDTAQVILLALDLDGRVTLANRYACTVLGWDCSDLIGSDWAETCLPEAIRTGFRRRFEQLLAGELPMVENLVVTRSGEERLIEWRNTVLRDDDGRVAGSFSSGTDITGRNQAIVATRDAEERMRFALESANVGIWDQDFITGTLRWSPLLEAQYGLAPGAFPGTFEAFQELVHPDDRESVQSVLAAATAGGADFIVNHRALWADGTVRWLSGAGRIQLDEGGAPLRGVGISQDATSRHTLEAQHQQAQKMEAVGQLAAGVAHDFNNLLTVISGFTELAAEGIGEASQSARDLDEVIKAARRATDLTRQLLAFSRQQVLDAVPLDVNALITDMTRMLDRLIGSHIEVSLVLAPGLALAQADRGQLEQVVMNLAVNARDAMPAGGRLTIETAGADLETSPFHAETVVAGPYVMVAVTDTGTGMTKETQRRLFEPFYTTKEVGKGTGLGLSTTYGIVKQSKGHIWVYSELGRGTTFKVYLPQATGAPELPTASPGVTAPRPLAAETVLLVEDEEPLRGLARRILERAGYTVLEAANGTDGLRMYQLHATAIDLVVTDVVMPGCGGPELVSRLLETEPALRFLYMSGYTEQSLLSLGDLGRRPIVHKPFTAANLLGLVRDALDR